MTLDDGLGEAVRAAGAASQGGYVLIRRSASGQWKVNLRTWSAGEVCAQRDALAEAVRTAIRKLEVRNRTRP